MWIISGYILIGLITGFLLGWIIIQTRFSSIQRALEIENVQLKKDLEADMERMKWLEMTQEKMKESFKALSADLLSSNSAQFLNQAREKLSEVLELQKRDWGLHKEEFKGMVEPLGKNLEELDKQIREMEQKREGAYQGLIQQITQLGTSHQELQKTTINLTQALKSTTIRGRWGEIQLRRIVEMAGMISYVDFNEQVTVDEGRPDMLIHLPNQGIIPVDSKAPMNAYLESQEIADEDNRQRKLEEHAKAMRNHMKSLSQKAYWSQFPRSPEFVVLVVPYDSGLTAAFERDGKLLEDALQNKVLIVSPVSLLALLKVIAYGWLQLQLAENAQKIADQGKELFSRFVTFSGHLGEMGRKLNLTVQSYNKSVGSLESRIIPSIQRLKEMGAGSAEIPEVSQIDLQARELPQPEDSEED
ncbi:MAG: DNA recombination protein RmuC [Calditrichia bacterium]|nr:DNA recombination protein RmuC [Calditrichia bacterium]